MFDWITDLLERTGAWGVALLAFLENVFPPIPSELIMPLAGFAAARGDQSLLATIAAGTLGSLAGAVLWYVVGRRLGMLRVERFADRHGRWLTLCPADLDRAMARFKKHGATAVLLGRLIPAVRTLISVPAGVAKMHLAQFAFYSALGTTVWTGILVVAGYLLESQYERVSQLLNPLSNAITLALAAWYVWRVATFTGPRSDRSASAQEPAADN